MAVDKDSCYGRLDVPLAAGFQQAVDQYKRTLPQAVESVYCSPSKRCADLARALPFEHIHFDDRLLELNFGDWEGKRWVEIDQEQLNFWMADFVRRSPPNGEALAELFERVEDFVNALRNNDQEQVLIVTHAGVIRCLWAYLLSIPLHNMFKIPVGFGETLIFDLSADSANDRIVQMK